LECGAALLALGDALVTIVVPTIANQGRFCSAGKARAECVFRNGSAQSSIKHKVGTFEHGILHLVLLESSVVADDSGGETTDICESQLLREVGANLMERTVDS
jgi:hypothetical protein